VDEPGVRVAEVAVAAQPTVEPIAATQKRNAEGRLSNTRLTISRILPQHLMVAKTTHVVAGRSYSTASSPYVPGTD